MVDTDPEVSKWKQRQRMKMLWKYYKVGRWDSIAHTVTEEEKEVLRRYYGALV